MDQRGARYQNFDEVKLLPSPLDPPFILRNQRCFQSNNQAATYNAGWDVNMAFRHKDKRPLSYGSIDPWARNDHRSDPSTGTGIYTCLINVSVPVQHSACI
jgi:hypothetical protein